MVVRYLGFLGDLAVLLVRLLEVHVSRPTWSVKVKSSFYLSREARDKVASTLWRMAVIR